MCGRRRFLLALLAPLAAVGCKSRMRFEHPEHPMPLGSQSDAIFQQQEDNAEAAKFVIYNHEFELNKPEWEIRLNRPYDGPERGFRLSPNGQDHVRRIAAKINEGVSYPVVIERSRTSVREDTRYKYPVHFSDELDLRRRDLVVQALQMLGVEDADARVVVAPAFSEGLEATEAAQAYQMSRQIGTTIGGMNGGGTGGMRSGIGGF